MMIATTASSRRKRQGILTLILGVWAIYLYSSFTRPTNHLRPSSTSSIYNTLDHLLGGTSSVKCPSPLTPTVPVDTKIDSLRPRDTCHSLPSSHPDFAVEVCPIKDSCGTFQVFVTRTNSTECARIEKFDVLLKDAPERAPWFKEHKGPDSFLIRTSGAQRWATQEHDYEGKCRYRFDVTLSNGGPVWLEAWWLYTEYNHYDEVTNRWPPNHFTPILELPVNVDTCPGRCSTHFAPKIDDADLSIFSPSLIGNANHKLDSSSRGGTLPLCSNNETINGIWLMRHPMDAVHPPALIVPPRGGIEPLMGLYEWVPHGCRFEHAGMQFRDHKACFGKPFRVIMGGDSHVRYLMNAIRYRFDGHQEYYSDDDRGKFASDGPYHFQYDQLAIDFTWDVYADWPRIKHELLPAYDAVIHGAGAWSSMEGHSEENYRMRLERLCRITEDAWQNNPQPQKQIRIFVTHAPYPPHTSGASRDRGDKRTNAKMSRFRDVAKEVMGKNGWLVVDQFERGMGVLLEMNAADGMHLSPGSAHPSIVDEVIAKAGFCAYK